MSSVATTGTAEIMNNYSEFAEKSLWASYQESLRIWGEDDPMTHAAYQRWLSIANQLEAP